MWVHKIDRRSDGEVGANSLVRRTPQGKNPTADGAGDGAGPLAAQRRRSSCARREASEEGLARHQHEQAEFPQRRRIGHTRCSCGDGCWFIAWRWHLREHGRAAHQRRGAEGDKLALSEFKTVRVLGEGTSGVVKLVKHRPTSGRYAMKVIQLGCSEQERKQILIEVKTLHKSHVPGIITFFDAFYADNAVHIILEYMDCGSLAGVLKRHGSLPEPLLARVSGDMLGGLAHLHRVLKVVHRDIKPSNVLLNSRGEVKLADFGMSGQLASTFSRLASWVGTAAYMSPERISGAAIFVRVGHLGVRRRLVGMRRRHLPVHEGDGRGRRRRAAPPRAATAARRSCPRSRAKGCSSGTSSTSSSSAHRRSSRPTSLGCVLRSRPLVHARGWRSAPVRGGAARPPVAIRGGRVGRIDCRVAQARHVDQKTVAVAPSLRDPAALLMLRPAQSRWSSSVHTECTRPGCPQVCARRVRRSNECTGVHGTCIQHGSQRRRSRGRCVVWGRKLDFTVRFLIVMSAFLVAAAVWSAPPTVVQLETDLGKVPPGWSVEGPAQGRHARAPLHGQAAELGSSA